MNTATSCPRVIVGAPGSLLQFCAGMDKIAEQMRQQTLAINKIMQPMQRAMVFITEQYMKSPLAKKRAAKINLTAACNRALTKMRRTYHELVAHLIAHIDTKVLKLPHELFIELQHANAPNRCTVKSYASLRHELQTTKAGTHDRI